MDWAAVVLCLTGAWFLAHKHRWAFFLSMAGNALMVAWAVLHTPLLPSVIFINGAFLFLQVRSYRLWGRDCPVPVLPSGHGYTPPGYQPCPREPGHSGPCAHAAEWQPPTPAQWAAIDAAMSAVANAQHKKMDELIAVAVQTPDSTD